MSDERPAQPTPREGAQPEGAQPEEPEASATDAPASGTDTPTPDAAPAADEAPTVEHAAAAPDEAPTVVDPATTTAATDPPAAEATPPPSAVAPAPADRGRGVFVPAWVAAVVAVLVVAGLGFAIGWIAAPRDDSDTSSAVATSPNDGSTDDGGSTGGGNDRGNRTLPAPDEQETVPPLVSGAYLGVTLEESDDSGVRIGSVAEDSPAAEAGLEAGDVITAVDGDEVTSPLDLVRAIRQHDPDDEITITYTRNGTSAEARVTLAERPERQSVS